MVIANYSVGGRRNSSVVMLAKAFDSIKKSFFYNPLFLLCSFLPYRNNSISKFLLYVFILITNCTILQFIFRFLSRPNANPMKAIEVCINALNDNILQLFKKLAILPDNVKVSAKVLSKLWNREIPEVNSIMKQLKAKSLVIETYDREQRNYLYEVHDIIMSYLRTCLSEDEKHKIHDLFLNSYDYTRNNAPVEILDDGYIAFFVGYHILNTRNLNDKWSLFKKLFLNLKFLGNKVRLTGSADVILDLRKYESNIAADVSTLLKM